MAAAEEKCRLCGFKYTVPLTSNSFSSKYWSHCSGTTSLKPSRKALVWPSTPRENLHSAIRLWTKKQLLTKTEIKGYIYITAVKVKLSFEPDILLLVFLSDEDVGAVMFEVMRGDLSQDLHVHWEVHLQTTLFNVVVPEETWDHAAVTPW